MLIEIEKLNKTNFIKYGNVISIESSIEKTSINRGWTDKFDKLSSYKSNDPQFSKPIFSIFRGLKRPKPFSINMLECHPLASQAFMPLNGNDWLIVVCNDKNGEPELNNIRCFSAKSNQGINYFPGIWHHPLITLEDGQCFLVLERDNSNDNNSENLIECHFNDILIYQ